MSPKPFGQKRLDCSVSCNSVLNLKKCLKTKALTNEIFQSRIIPDPDLKRANHFQSLTFKHKGLPEICGNPRNRQAVYHQAAILQAFQF